jgi:hypothetical protein
MLADFRGAISWRPLLKFGLGLSIASESVLEI